GEQRVLVVRVDLSYPLIEPAPHVGVEQIGDVLPFKGLFEELCDPTLTNSGEDVEVRRVVSRLPHRTERPELPGIHKQLDAALFELILLDFPIDARILTMDDNSLS